MSTPTYIVLEKWIDDAYGRLDREQLTPWAFFNSGRPLLVNDYYGGSLRFEGITFDGDPRRIFWGGYISPFLEGLTEELIERTLQFARDKQQPPEGPLRELKGLMQSLVRKVFARMADIDRRLRGGGYPESVPLRSVDGEVATLDAFIDQRVEAGIAMLPKLSRWRGLEAFYRDQPAIVWILGLGISVLLTLVGAWLA